MAAPTYAASGTYYENSSATPSVGAPSGVVANSVLVFVAYVDGAADPVITAGTGWAHAPGSPVYEDDDPIDGSLQNHRIAIVWHRATGSEAGPYGPITLGSSQFLSGQVHRYEGCKTSGDPFDTAFDVAGRTVSVTDSPSVSVTTGGADETVLHAATNWSGGPWTPASGLTERQDGGTFHHSMLADKTQAVAGSTGSVVATATGNNKSQAWLGALLPAVSNLTADSSAATTASPSATANTLQPASASAAATAAASGTATVSSPAVVSTASTATATPTAAATSPASLSTSIAAAAAGSANTVQPAAATGGTTASASIAAARGDTADAVHATTASATAAVNLSLAVAASATSTASTSAAAAASSPAASVASVVAHVTAVAGTGQATPGRLTATNARRAALAASHT